ncbi:MAG TPA: outer membrane beta-barrel protein [Thermoanaerobaculia bacterium]|nr:outer membrane beta-barrel protein [Thermoanaerobaculia bacterium]
MKKTVSVLCGMAVLALLAGPAKAADFGLFGSYWDTKDADQGYGGGVKFDFARFIELRASYFNDVTSNNPLPHAGDFKVHVTPLEAGLVFKFAPGERFTPYLGGGGGYYLLDTNRGNIDNETGWYAVAGADIKTDHGAGIMLEAIYRSMDTTVRDRSNGSTTFDDRVDLQLRGFGANVGVVWSF